MPGFYLGEIQYIADDPQQADSRFAYVLRVFQYGRILSLPLYHLVHAEDGCDRGAYLMTHVRKESCLGYACLFGGLQSLLQLLRPLLLLGRELRVGDIPDEHIVDLAVARQHGEMPVVTDPAHVPVLPDDAVYHIVQV